jgi:hypothetical protein
MSLFDTLILCLAILAQLLIFENLRAAKSSIYSISDFSIQVRFGIGQVAMDPAEHGANTASVKEFDSNVMNVFPEIDAPYTRPPRKNTNFPKFPPGFSPWSDERDPGADPGAYPPATRHHFEELLKDVGSGIHPLVQHYVAPIWNQITNILIHTKFVTGLLGVLIAPIWVYVKVIDNWRHYNGWLYYLFYYIAATQGYLLRTNECWRVLREGPNKRFTITKQFWHRRGCEGGSDGFAIRDQLMHTVSLMSLGIDRKVANK